MTETTIKTPLVPPTPRYRVVLWAIWRFTVVSLWWLYAVTLTITTLGVFPRFHLITRRVRLLGGVRAGKWGGTHVYRDGPFVVVSSLFGKARFPVNQISEVATGVLRVKVSSTGADNRKIDTWKTRTVARYILGQRPGR